jgi:hypothetical protein
MVTMLRVIMILVAVSIPPAKRGRFAVYMTAGRVACGVVGGLRVAA